jgi:hypothetical protein
MFILDPNFSIPEPGSKRFQIPDPDLDFLPIPDPGVKKALDPVSGSATQRCHTVERFVCCMYVFLTLDSIKCQIF